MEPVAGNEELVLDEDIQATSSIESDEPEAANSFDSIALRAQDLLLRSERHRATLYLTAGPDRRGAAGQTCDSTADTGRAFA